MNIRNNFESSKESTNLFAWIDNIFTDDELIEIIKYCNNFELQDGEVIENKNHGNSFITHGNIDKTIRNSKINFFNKDNNNEWIFNKFNNAILYANENFFDFDLIGYDYIQYSKYSIDEYYHPHIDLIFGINDNRVYNAHARKLSLTLLLNDNYSGGEFKIYQGLTNPTILPTKKGRCYFFPSFLVHEVAPVTEGQRFSLVIWVMGPRWK